MGWLMFSETSKDLIFTRICFNAGGNKLKRLIQTQLQDVKRKRSKAPDFTNECIIQIVINK